MVHGSNFKVRLLLMVLSGCLRTLRRVRRNYGSYCWHQTAVLFCTRNNLEHIGLKTFTFWPCNSNPESKSILLRCFWSSGYACRLAGTHTESFVPQPPGNLLLALSRPAWQTALSDCTASSCLRLRRATRCQNNLGVYAVCKAARPASKQSEPHGVLQIDSFQEVACATLERVSSSS